jgi:hypothetical protein
VARPDRPDGRGEKIVIDPRSAFRARQRQLVDGDPLDAPPPGLLGNPDGLPFGLPRTPLGPLPDEPLQDDWDPYQVALRLRVRPGHRSSRKARVRVYHRLPGAPRIGLEGRCWSFTITRVAYERLVTDRILDSEGATYPNGQPVVPPDEDPLYVAVQCGSCGSQNVECLQMEFWEGD